MNREVAKLEEELAKERKDNSSLRSEVESLNEIVDKKDGDIRGHQRTIENLEN